MNDTVKAFLVGLFSNIIKGGISVIVTAIAFTHPVIAQVIAPATDPFVVNVVATFISVLLVSVAGAILRQARHAKIFEEALQQALDQTPSKGPS